MSDHTDLKTRIRATSREWFVRVACYLGIASMATMIWSVLDPRPIPVMMAMSAGQAGALLAFVTFLVGLMVRHRKTEDEPEP